MDVLFFPGCVLTYFYTSLIQKTVSVLEENGFTVAFPKGLNCCGFPYITQGREKRFLKLKEQNRKIIETYDFKYLVAPCGTCTYSFKEFYDLQGSEVHELTDFMYRFAKNSKLNREILSPELGKVTFHDPCHNLKSYGIKQQPRSFLKQLGDRFVDDNGGLCCGFGGIFSVGFPKTSKSIFNRKKEVLKNSGAETVVTSCPGCYLQLESNLKQDVKFFIELF